MISTEAGIRVPERIHADLIVPQPNPRNPLIENTVYARIGTNRVFQAQPAIVHFCGYTLDRIHEHVVRVVNISKTSHRLVFIPPSTKHFRLKFSKKGLLAPGMSEDIVVEFCPTEWRYYYDCIKVHSELENIVIPIHAYPAMNETIFPSFVDMGKCPISEVTSKTIPLTCKVPVHFEFEIRIIKPHPDFRVAPLKGVVPASGHIDVCIDFRPSVLATATTEIEVTVAQFSLQPIVCVITGSAAPGLTRDTMVKDTLRAHGLLPPSLPFRPHEISRSSDRNSSMVPEPTSPSTTTRPITGTDVGTTVTASKPSSAAAEPFLAGPVIDANPSPNTIASTLVRTMKAIGVGASTLDNYSRTVALHVVGGGAGHGDRVSRAVALHTRVPKLRKNSQEGLELGLVRKLEQERDGIRIPEKPLAGHATVSYILQQNKGKPNLKQLHEILEAKGSGTPRFASEESSRGHQSNVASRQMKEIKFDEEFRKAVELEKNKQVKWFVCTGDPLITPDQLAGVHRSRASHTERELDHAQRADLLRSAHTALDWRPCRQAHDVASWHTPTWDENLNDNFRKRAMVLRRFRQAANRVIIINRMNRVLSYLSSLVKVIHRSETSTNESVASNSRDGTPERLHVLDAMQRTIVSAEPDLRTKFHIDADRISFAPFVVPPDEDECKRDLVPVHPIPSSVHYLPYPLKVGMQYKLLGYKPISVAPFPQYPPLETERKLRSGAFDEDSVRGPRGASPLAPYSATAAPDIFFHPIQPDILATPGVDMYHAQVRPTENDDEYSLETERVVRTSIAVEESIGRCSVEALSKYPTLADRWLPRRERAFPLPFPVPVPLLRGPEADDLMPDSRADADEAPVNVQLPIPTLQTVRQSFLIPDKRGALPEQSAEDAEREQERGNREVKYKVVEMPRQRDEIALWAEQRKMWTSNASRIRSTLANFNSAIEDPRLKLRLFS